MSSDRIQRLQRVLAKPERLLIGLMSGMSMDGVDLALVRVGGTFPDLQITLVDCAFQSYPVELRARLLAARDGSAHDVCELNVDVGTCFAETVLHFLQKSGLKSEQIDAIGSHGQTLVHIPPGAKPGSTLQIGSGSLIAERTGILTISSFRERDMAAGGQGAPLVPLVDWLLYRRADETVALNNLGSVSNVTVVTPALADVWAFDTGPANMPIDYFAARDTTWGKPYDADGELSGRGQVIPEFLDALLRNPYFDTNPPKSAGYAEFGPRSLETAARPYAGRRSEDLVRTAVEYAAETLARAYERFVLPRVSDLRRIWLSGGGVHNRTFVTRLQARLPALQIEPVRHEHPRFADAKEALAFAVLANEVLSGRPTTVPGATGARHAVVSGEIAL